MNACSRSTNNMTKLVASVLVAMGTFLAFGQESLPVSGWKLQDAAKTSGDGSILSRPGYQTSGWYPAVVPGTVLTSLVKAGVYPEPLYGENNRKIPESLCRTPYWYRTTIVVPKSFAGKHVWLDFDGINYMAEVWVGGAKAGEIKGAFTRGYIDISRHVSAGKSAVIAVKILPPNHPNVPHEHTLALGTGRNGGDMGADGPTFLATVGWDWIPAIRDRDMGIWQPVRLRSSSDIVLSDPQVRSNIKGSNADIFGTVTIQNCGTEPIDGSPMLTIDGERGPYFFVPVTIHPGETRTVELQPYLLKNAKLWWPNGYGAQNLYRGKVTFVQTGSQRTIASTSVKFGVHRIQNFRDGSTDMTIIVNGVKVFCKGGNWGMDEAMKRIPRERLEAQIRLHRDAHFTMIRNWIGMATEEDFYDLCDKYGILVWDDFWIANPVDGPNPIDNGLFLANAREKVLRYRNHPSVGVWCGRNEGNPPAVLNQGLENLIKELDPDRFYQPHSSATNGVGGGGPYAYRKPTEYFKFRDALHTEIGAPAIPTLESIKAMMPAKDWWPINDDWAEHDFARGAQGGDSYPKVLAERFGKVRGFEDFVRKAQLANYESYRAMFEGRMSKLFSPATGVLLWMSNPAQPSFVWQTYSYDLEPTSAFYGSQKACEPVHVMLDQTNNNVLVVNNRPWELRSVRVRAFVYDLQGHGIGYQFDSLTAGPSASKTAFRLLTPKAKTNGVRFVMLEADDAKGEFLSDNFYWISQPDESNNYTPGDFSSMQGMPYVDLIASAKVTKSAGRQIVRVELSNQTPHIAVMTHLQLRNRRTGMRVLPAFASDNFLNLVGHYDASVTFDYAGSVRAEDLEVVVDGWNIRSVEPPAIGIATDRDVLIGVRLNKDAVVAPLDLKVATPPTGFTKNIACGNSSAEGTVFVRDDAYAEGGQTRNIQEAPVDVSGSERLAAPLSVYKSGRAGESTFTIPVPRGNRSFHVLLHFVEQSFSSAGSRVFNVAINDKPVLSDFDIFAAAGKKGKLVVKELPGIVADANGSITISFRRGTIGNPEVRAIQVIEDIP